MPYKDPLVRKAYLHNYDRCRRNRERGEMSYAYDIKVKYNLTLENYNNILTKQNFCCGLCKRHISEFSRRFCVDHNHITGKVRGLLCVRCNVSVGSLLDTPESIQNVLKYVNDVDSGI